MLQVLLEESLGQFFVAGRPVREVGVAGRSVREVGVVGRPVREVGVAGRPVREVGVAGRPVREVGVAGLVVLLALEQQVVHGEDLCHVRLDVVVLHVQLVVAKQQDR